MATESGGDETATRSGTRPAVPAVPGTRPAVMYTDEGKLEFDKDEMATLEGQLLDAEFRCGIY